MSWLSSRLIQTPKAVSAPMLDCLKASAIGLGDGDCDAAFFCDIELLKQEQKLQRQKRATENYKFRWNI